ncbi:MAG: DUF3987 domain-containing protein [Bacteroidaceae bacterium]|nr:DUF3987 domain-containing protein [Bacteroidaceae bacterium]
MKIDIYRNKRSVRPCISVQSHDEFRHWLDCHEEIEACCTQIEKTGNKEWKDSLPAIMPMGTVGDKTRKKENCTPTGLVMIDVDGTERIDARGEELRFADEDCRRLGVRFIHITPSHKGLRVIAECHADGMEATVGRIVSQLGLERFGAVDPACKDLSRLSYLVPQSYWVYVNGLFDEVPSESIEAMKGLQWTGTTEKYANVQTKVGEVLENDELFRDFKYNGIRVADLVQEWIESTGGAPEEGQRHTFYNNLIVQFRNLCNNDAKIVHAVLPAFDRPVEETWAQCVSLCSSNRTTRLEKNIYFFLKDRGYLLDRTMAQVPDKAEEREPLPPMPKLPPVFRQYVNAAPPDFKVPTIVALLPILGTLTSHLRATYFDDSEQSTEFISLLFAPPSSGKSFIKRLSGLLQNLRDRDELANAREEIYASGERRRGANDRGEEAPRVSVRIVKPLISIPELLTKMRNNQGHHMYIEAEELDTFTKGNRTAGGDKSDLWRITWDNGFYGQYYKSANTFKGEVQMFMNLLFTCTQDQINRFFKNVEDGLVTRFSVCPIENQQFAKFVPWKAIPKTEQAQIDNILNRLEMKVYKMPLKFDKSVLLDVAPEDFDRVVPWQYDFQPLERVDLSYIYQPLLDWLERERVVSAETLNPARDVFRRRAAVKGFRLALMCHGLYSNVGKRERGIIIDFVRWFCTVDLYHSLCQFGEQYNEMQNSVKAKGVPHDKVFSRMGDTFGKEDVRMALAKAFIKTPVSNVISLWKANRLIEKTGENMYRKLK